MDYSIPPSYNEATNQHWLPLVAPYLSSDSLCSAVLVSIEWHQYLIPWLWGDPASHFGTEGDRVYVALTRFKRTLSIASLRVRQLTHTLHLPPAQTELYDRPQYQWLRDVLERLPNLQCLVVSQIPFFDHSALLALRASSSASVSPVSREPSTFPLQLLIASQCNNCIPASLVSLAVHFPRLVFLDLSHTPAARDDNVLSSLGLLRHLQILKLRRVGFKDANLELLASALNPRLSSDRTHRSPNAYRLRSLDLRDNELTDRSVKTIVQRLIHPDRGRHRLNQLFHDPQSSSIQGPTLAESSMNDPLWRPDLDQYFIRTFTQPKEGRVYLEDLSQTGLTHLYLANNPISSEALIDVIQTQNLHVLDVGNLETSQIRSSSRLLLNTRSSHLHDTQTLAHPLEDHGAELFTYLRIDHAVITGSAGPSKQKQVELDAMECQAPNIHEVHGQSSINSTTRNPAQQIFELENNAPAYELPGQDTWYAELPDNSIKDEKQNSTVTKDDKFISLPAYQLDESSSLPELVSDIRSPASTSETFSAPPAVSRNARLSFIDARFEISRLIGKRQELRHGIRDERRGLLPGRLPALQSLVLTEVPNLTRSSKLIQNIKDFIADCAMEHHLATKQAYLEEILNHSDMSTRCDAIRKRARDLFALQTIVLELEVQRSGEPSEAEILPSPSSSPTIRSPPSKAKTLSSVDDRDTESLWRAAKNDFSFFDDEECGVPASDATNRVPMSALMEKFALDEDDTSSENPLLSPLASRITHRSPLRDVVAEVARWRSDRRRQQQICPQGTFAPGFWPGEVKIVRPNKRVLQQHVDYYGNYFEKGIYR